MNPTLIIPFLVFALMCRSRHLQTCSIHKALEESNEQREREWIRTFGYPMRFVNRLKI